MERFKIHFNDSKKCNKKTSLAERPLTTFFARASAPKPDDSRFISRPRVPCPGLTGLDDPRIIVYLSRTACSTGGAPPYHVLKTAIIKRTPDVSDSELEKRIHAEEYHQARWINKHDVLAIYSPNCLKTGFVSFDGITGCCIVCRFLLKLKTLQNALRRPPPEKPKHTPKRYRNEVLGECYLRHADVHDLVMRV